MGFVFPMGGIPANCLRGFFDALPDSAIFVHCFNDYWNGGVVMVFSHHSYKHIPEGFEIPRHRWVEDGTGNHYTRIDQGIDEVSEHG